MTKNILIAIGTVVVIAAGIMLFSGRSNAPTINESGGQEQETDTQENLENKLVTVSYSENGFSPSQISVSPGTKVVFVNKSSAAMWVASAPHPVHTDLPEFDARMGTPKGSSYEFTFTKEGTWRYHDHLAPSYTGRVIVQ